MINTFNIKEKIFNIDGFKISNTHFKIGAKIHASEFFYAKRLFQNSYYTARIAILLAIQIKKELSDQNESLTLIGYEYYSELLLSLIKKFLSDFGYKDVNHFLVIDLDEKVKIHPPNFQLLDNAVIIVPIASTGSTAKKIEEYIKSINKVEKTRFFNKHFNVILANDTDDSFKDVNSHTSAQHSFIQLNVNWENPSNCKWCFNDSVSRPLFGTDKSSLTPTLIFDLPSGKIKNQVDVEDEKDNLSINFDDVIFDGALIYRKAVRNNEHFLFSTNTEILLVKNMDNILPWLSNIKKKLSISPSEKIVIISPCHYSNMSFINLINEQLFNSSATIIHYQTNVDYHYNFKLLNESYLNRKGNKVFFVDDSLISGNSFFSIYDLFRFTTGYDKDIRLAGAIFLSDKSSPDIHKRVYRASSESLYSFVNINLPLPPKILGKKPLEHEEKRYEELSKYLLHDVMKKGFADKAKDLSGIEVSSNPDTRNKIQNAKETEEKDKRHLRMFKATHKVYDYFGKNNHIDSISFEKFLLECGFDSGLMEDKMAMMKVLSQYPFLLYKEIRQKSFLWHKDWINGKIRYLNQISFDDLVFTYNDFKELKFLIRRAVFLGNYRITNTDFFESINKVFVAIERKYILDYDKLSKSEIDNLEDFQNFLLKQYAELIYNNQWCAYRILKGINEFSFSTPQAKQFVRMVKIELAIVLRDFYALFNNTEAHDLIIQVFKEENPDVSETSSKIGINVDTEAIKENLKNREILASNKFEICDSALSLKDHNDELLPQFLNFLWIKLFTNFDYTNKVSGSNLSDKTGYIFEKARRLFKNSNKIGTFFIVSDGVNNPHLVYDKDANNMTFVENIDYKTHKALIRFLKGEINKSGYETIKEFKRETENIWEDEYSLTKEKL